MQTAGVPISIGFLSHAQMRWRVARFNLATHQTLHNRQGKAPENGSFVAKALDFACANPPMWRVVQWDPG